MFISDNSLLLYIVQRIMISSLRAQDPHARTPDTVSSNINDHLSWRAMPSNESRKTPSDENASLIFRSSLTHQK
jgi:hypothetical protein